MEEYLENVGHILAEILSVFDTPILEFDICKWFSSPPRKKYKLIDREYHSVNKEYL
jgi:hypothetical protein